MHSISYTIKSTLFQSLRRALVMTVCTLINLNATFKVSNKFFLFVALNWLLVTLSVLGKMFVAGAFDVLYIFSAELFPTVVRNAGMGTCSACARAGSMLSPYIAQLVM